MREEQDFECYVVITLLIFETAQFGNPPLFSVRDRWEFIRDTSVDTAQYDTQITSSKMLSLAERP
jgi:hypothetical protein